MAVLFVGDTGTRIKLDCVEDVSAATTRRIYYEKPDGDTGYWIAIQDGSDTGKIYYDTLAADIDVAGKWKFQSYVVMSGWTGHGELAELTAYDPISVT